MKIQGEIDLSAKKSMKILFMVDQLKRDSELTGSLIMLTTLFSLVTYTLGLSALAPFG